MILDATHLSDTSFFQALDTFSGPVLASHNNCRALVPDERQFSDEQIRLLIERGAVIGAALDAWMLAPGWVRGQTTRDVVSLKPSSTTSTNLPARRQRASRGDRQRPGRRIRDRTDPLGTRPDLRASEARCHADGPRVSARGDRRHLPRQLAAILPRDPPR